VLKGFFAASVLACAIGSVLPAQAATIVDTGPAHTNWDYNSWSLYSGQSLAALIRIDSATTIDGIAGMMTSFAGPASATVSLAYADGAPMVVNSGNGPVPKPGATLYSASFAVTTAPSWQGVGNVAWTVAAGDYWLIFASNDSLGFGNRTAYPVVTEAFRAADGNWYQQDGLDLALRVTGSPAGVPEPASWAMMVGGFGLVGASLRRRRPAIRFA
jgi:hypothetical protein